MTYGFMIKSNLQKKLIYSINRKLVLNNLTIFMRVI